MNVDAVLAALGVTVATGGLPLVPLAGRPVTVATSWSAQAVAVAARRRSPLVVVAEGPPDPAVSVLLGRPGGAVGRSGAPGRSGESRPWPVVAVGDSPWATRVADLGLLVGVRGPADHDGLDETVAAALASDFLGLAFDAPPSPPPACSLLDIVPFAVDGPYAASDVVAALADGGRWVEFDRDGAPEVLTAVVRVAGRSVGVAASRPTVGEGVVSPAGAARIARLVRWCEGAPDGGRPLVTLVDTNGIAACADLDEAEAVRVAATVLRRSPVLKIAVVTGRAVGLGATLLGAVGARADLVLPWPRARFALTPLDGSPGAEAAASVLGAAREADVLDVIHPDDTRSRVAEALELFRGTREYGR